MEGSLVTNLDPMQLVRRQYNPLEQYESNNSNSMLPKEVADMIPKTNEEEKEMTTGFLRSGFMSVVCNPYLLALPAILGIVLPVGSWASGKLGILGKTKGLWTRVAGGGTAPATGSGTAAYEATLAARLNGGTAGAVETGAGAAVKTGLLGTGLKFLGGVGCTIGAVKSAYEGDYAWATINGVGAGMFFGSMICPGIGTAIGAIVGGVAGTIGAFFGEKNKENAAQDQVIAKMEENYPAIHQQFAQLPELKSNPAAAPVMQLSDGTKVEFGSEAYKAASREEKIKFLSSVNKFMSDKIEDARVAGTEQSMFGNTKITGIGDANKLIGEILGSGMFGGGAVGKSTLPPINLSAAA